MKHLLIIILLSSLILAGCSQQTSIETENTTNSIDMDVSFRVHIIQFWWLHSSIYDWVYRPISSIDHPSPLNNASIGDLRDIDNSQIKIEYRWRKDYFKVSCSEDFYITDCKINGEVVISDQPTNSCMFYFEKEWLENSSIHLTCSNWKFRNPF